MESWDEEWRREYGARWLAALLLLGVLVVIRGSLDTLSDADLPMHLAIGEWIVRHRTLPETEPFAWTRAGSPFYAYSWAMELLMYGVADLAGKIGLRVMQGLMMAGAGASMIFLGRAARWNPRTSLLMAVTNLLVLSTVVSSVRPQTILFILVPLAWAFSYYALYSARPGSALVALAITSAIAVNAHLFFVLTAAPWLLWMSQPPNNRSRTYAVIAVTLGGWLVTPYLPVLPSVLSFGFHPSLLLLPPTPVKEAAPGFIAMQAYWALVPIALFLTCIPFVAHEEFTSRRQRFVWGAAWIVGLIGFAVGARLLLVWWMLVLPLAAGAMRAISDYLLASEEQARRLWRIVGVWALCALLLLSIGVFDPDAWRYEDPIRTHRLAPMQERGLESIATWLECNTRTRSGGHVYTVFNYGSALTWRLPRYSMSIDGRTIFPDSVAKAEVYLKPLLTPVDYGPWRSADLAIIPAASPLNGVIAQAPGWHEVAVVELFDTAAALWVTDKWWSRVGVGPIPKYPHSLIAETQPAHASSCAGLALPSPVA